MSKALQGRRILVTRPAHQAQGWCACLADLGATVDSIPMLAIEPVVDSAARQRIKDLILDFDQFEHAIFVSQNAVRQGFTWLEDYWPQLPQGPRYYGIGAATAAALGDYDVDSTCAGGAMDSEALLALPALQQVKDARVLIFRGEGGRTKLGDTLSSRGARVDYCELYRRTLPEQAQQQLAEYAHTPDAISVHSGETLSNLARSIDATGRADLLQSALICPSQRVATIGRQLGFAHPVAALNAGDSAMLDCLHALFGQNT